MPTTAKSVVGISPPEPTAQQRHLCDTGAFFTPVRFYGGLCEAPSRVAGTVAGRTNLVQSATITLVLDAGGLQTFNGDCYV